MGPKYLAKEVNYTPQSSFEKVIGSLGFALKIDINICSLTQSSSSNYMFHVRSLFIGWKKIRATLLWRLIPCGLVTVPAKTNILKPQRIVDLFSMFLHVSPFSLQRGYFCRLVFSVVC